MPTREARSLVAPPNRAPLPYGLLSVVQSVPDGDAHWENGIRYVPVPCGSAGVTLDPCPSPPADKTPTAVGLQESGADPFTVYAWESCLTDNPRDVARQLLANGEERSVERVFWTGSPAATGSGSIEVWPHLAEDTAVNHTFGVRTDRTQTAATVLNPTPGTAVDLVEGLGLLEQALAWCYGNQGVIHMPRSLGVGLANQGMVKASGNQLLTNPNGNLIALGSGYTGTGPTGALAAGSTWIYGTGAVFMRRSDVRVLDGFDQLKNSNYVIAERTYALGWECCHFAVQIAAGGFPAGAAGSAGAAS